jgi:hypothetical protein
MPSSWTAPGKARELYPKWKGACRVSAWQALSFFKEFSTRAARRGRLHAAFLSVLPDALEESTGSRYRVAA